MTSRREWLIQLIQALRQAILELASETATSVRIGTTQYTLADVGTLRKQLDSAEEELQTLETGKSRSGFVGLRFGGNR